MTGPDQHDETGHDDVRALLADLGSAGSHPPGPVPDDVAARLDATLAELADLSAPTGPTGRTESGPAQEHRRWTRLLVAAAVVLVLGAGGVTTARLVTQGSGEETASSGSSGSSSADAGGSTAEESLRAPEDLPPVRRTTLAADAAVLLDTRTAVRAESALGTCAPPPGRGEQLAVSLDGEAAVLVARPARDGRRVVEAWACDASRVLARTRVAAPPR